MKIWMTGELQADVWDFYSTSWKKIEGVFNKHFESNTFGEGLVDFTYVAIIKENDSPDYDEIKKYRKRESSVEFRLKIPHNVFLIAEEGTHIKLVAASVYRAVKILPQLKIPNFDCAAFEAEFVALAKENAWF